ncbi:MAG TPA: hypothetical protein VFV52_08005 [Bacilli bacterium]|nr:hypothetical protein [Bacilli bacterium]
MNLLTHFVKDDWVELEIREAKEVKPYEKYIRDFSVHITELESKGERVWKAAVQILEKNESIMFIEIEDLYLNEQETELVKVCETSEEGRRRRVPGLIRANRFELSPKFEEYTKARIEAIDFFLYSILLKSIFISMIVEDRIIQEIPQNVQDVFLEHSFRRTFSCNGVTYWRADDPADPVWG